MYGDNCNFDGYTNSIYTISIGAISSRNQHPAYSEPCSAQIAVTYSSGSNKQITTTDVNVNNLKEPVCTSSHGGTSAAAPIAAGIFALVLSARPDLTWRDLQRLAIESAVPVALDDDDWVDTVNGRKFNHKFGYGKLDTEILIKNAEKFKLLNKQTSFETDKITVNAFFQGNTPVTSSVTIKPEDVEKFKHLEHVNVRVNLKHQRRGDVKIDLISPHGLVSNVATSRKRDASEMGLVNWLFMSVKHWDEDPVGEWKLVVQNEFNTYSKGQLIDWTLILWGEEKGENDNDNNTNDPSDEKPKEEKPDTPKEDEKPEEEKPDTPKEDETPEDEKPEDEKPEDGKPDTPKEDEKPEDEKPEDEKPEDEKPEDEKPEDEKPDDEKPDDEKPDTPKEDEKPEDEKPDTPKEDETPEDEKPEDENPEDEKPDTPKEDETPEDEKPDTPEEESSEIPVDESTPGDGKLDPERTHEAIVAAEFAVGIVAAAGLGLICWRYTRKRNYRDDIEFQILDQQQKLMSGDDDDDFYDDNIDEDETEMHNKVIFENHFLDEDEDENENNETGEIDLLEDEDYSSQASV